ncbi:PepSY domain-containing protein [Marinimicrobium sp. C2-29]|uniref:PepSY domain-containing protein n=1 Tax=Marinimicrobium sp. C2-29 TaxID=3139825 RepID=UPI0031390914
MTYGPLISLPLARRLALGARLLLVLIAASGTAFTVAAPAHGASPMVLAQSEERISASQAAAIVQKHYGGKVLKVQSTQKNGRLIYRVKILLDNGRVRNVGVDAQSGRLLRS